MALPLAPASTVSPAGSVSVRLTCGTVIVTEGTSSIFFVPSGRVISICGVTVTLALSQYSSGRKMLRGTAMYAGMVGAEFIQNRLKMPVTVSIASEFRYSQPVIDEKSLVIVVSQSGETIDTIEALKQAKSNGFEQAELEVVADNTRAYHLYESLGFVPYGRRPHGMKYKDGTYADEIAMVKML